MADEAHISVVVAYHCAQQVRESSMKTHPLKAEVWLLVSSRAYQCVPSLRLLDWAGPCAIGRTRSMPTSTEVAPAMYRTEAINGIIELGRCDARG